MTNVNANVDIDRLAKQLDRDIDGNDQTGALVRLCNTLPSLREYRTMARMIQTTHDRDGEMTRQNRVNRDKLIDFMCANMFAQLTPADYAKLRMAL